MEQHEDELTHSAQALFVALAALGFLFLGGSCWATGGFLREHAYLELGNSYGVVAGVMVLASVLLLTLAVRLSKQDYQGWRSAGLLSSGWIAILLGGVGIADMVCVIRGGEALFPSLPLFIDLLKGMTILLVTLLVGWGVYRSTERKRLEQFLLEQLRSWHGREETLERLLRGFYQEYDLNEDASRQYGALRDELIKDVPEAKGLFENLEQQVMRQPYLRGEEHHLLNWTRELNHPHVSAGKAVDASPAPPSNAAVAPEQPGTPAA